MRDHLLGVKENEELHLLLFWSQNHKRNRRTEDEAHRNHRKTDHGRKSRYLPVREQIGV